jgi:phosphoglucomutase
LVLVRFFWCSVKQPSSDYQGLCAYVLEHVNDAKSRGAVIGYDHRHRSERWAQLTAAAFHDKGVKTYLYRGLVHTPM